MDKTIEEMKNAVLAYCEEVCPIMDSEYVMSPGTKLVHRVLKGDWTQWELQCWNGGTCQWERSFCASPYMGEDDPHFGYLYRIFGLEARDAVAEKEAQHAEKVKRLIESMRRQDEVYTTLHYAHLDSKQELDHTQRKYAKTDANLQSERARNAALVAALEKIKEEHGYRYTYGDGFGNVTEKRLSSLGVAIDLLIAANTEKGGAND